ncbi:hypothetical protein A3A93_06050 [Candidatus Roizmanbacteria bacterium RIFCSPLOWO2_01_FULL_38_12]|uniref:Mannose-6-phosphate isomerase n=1 Tax=Candidatus Roizmanbacteria bacterium RIFCSPLOWO2_01_FULL_38_12 TaxID=1802061 RepID=A0A1F7IVC5_9BACT|nr:MAG: hypothetical protein A2861_03050 [Candidatus Roizmanbacteria bacterium RIFCSPHIGHO2_01_FULL_38_15]OGK36281.1 MAG: hypothetical protein A3F59_00190 [Candidatus Roizmanbacteria bacterium RIFCSPHIGHO2_12_FULL_38_13]OGK47320.1 MAG: hypothetical protein A3A93_06050 [Candidatus Roizmanbacteria bacterium RIFCSPLOWO2_01_FULL_38_12]
MNILRPFLILPQFIEQPTWGGDYIPNLKNWKHKMTNPTAKIGQSYELSGESKLITQITNSDDSNFSPALAQDPNTVSLADLIAAGSEQVLGKKIADKDDRMPLLIKLNQAKGNSFQLHLKPGQAHPRWKPKPESWYFLEDGYISCGVNTQADMHKYKETCQEIEKFMHALSLQISSGAKPVNYARQEAENFIISKDPWKFVNLHHVKKYDLIDLSAGGIHHSWEEKINEYPRGNIIFEVQLDVKDEFCTIRSFDQGKIKDDGTLREIHIEDYFHFLDTNPQNNDISMLTRKKQGSSLVKTPYYTIDIFENFEDVDDQTNDSFVHLYVRDGGADIQSGNTLINVSKGHSCLIPAGVQKYKIHAKTMDTALLKTYIS